MTRAVLLSEHDPALWAARWARGEVAAELPYGAEALHQHGVTTTTVPVSGARWAAKVRAVAEHRSGLVLERPLRGLAAVRRADLVIALLEAQGMLPAMLKGRGIPPYAGRPLVAVTCWLADDLRAADPATRRRTVRRLAAVDLLTHFGSGESGILVDAGFDERRLLHVDLGVSAGYFTPDGRQRDLDVLAVGQDRGRDYATLFEAVRGTALSVHVVCRPGNVAGLDVPPNVEVSGPVPLAAYRDLLRRARVVAVPTRELAYPTGSSVALEAAASGCAVVATGTPGLRDHLVDGTTAVLVGVGDADGWRSALTALHSDGERRAALGAAARADVLDRFTTERMWARIVAALRERDLLPAAER